VKDKRKFIGPSPATGHITRLFQTQKRRYLI
jgi:hypothetical protein